MQGKYGTAIRKAFQKQMALRLPTFERDSDSALPPGWLVYRCGLTSNLFCFIVLGVANRYDEFTIELIYHSGRELPPHIPLRFPTDPPTDGSHLIRLGMLWLPGNAGDYWWQVTPRRTQEELTRYFMNPLAFVEPPQESPAEIREKIHPLVSDAVERLLTYGIPYFSKVANEHNCEFPVADTSK